MAVLTDQPLLTDPATGDLIHVVDISAGGAGVSKRATLSSVSALISPALVNIIEHTVSATYVPTTGTTTIKFYACGAGGAGGNTDGQGAGTDAMGASGSGGGTEVIVTSTIDASYTITIGAKGLPGAGASDAGGDGGDTTVVSASINITGEGGEGGNGMVGTAGDSTSLSTLAGVGSGGDYTIGGTEGSVGRVLAGSRVFGISGGSYFGGGRSSNSGPGINGINRGSGGTGATSTNTATDNLGADGQDGVVIVEEYS